MYSTRRGCSFLFCSWRLILSVFRSLQRLFLLFKLRPLRSYQICSLLFLTSLSDYAPTSYVPPVVAVHEHLALPVCLLPWLNLCFLSLLSALWPQPSRSYGLVRWEGVVSGSVLWHSICLVLPLCLVSCVSAWRCCCFFQPCAPLVPPHSFLFTTPPY